MASTKRIGFFLGEEKITLAEFEKNNLLHTVSSPLGLKSNTPSAFNSSFTEEIQMTAIFQKMLQDNRIMGGTFYASIPMKEIILRSFVVPVVKREEIQNAIKFEARKYLPIDIQDLAFVYYSNPFVDNDVKRLQIIFFGVRKETLSRYDRLFKQVNVVVNNCEPSMVSLTKFLLYKKEIKPTDHLAFLILDRNIGRICFIDRGIPQFIREFSISSPSTTESAQISPESLNLRIVNEVGSSIDFYARQFIGDRIDQILVSAEGVGQELFTALETELKLKLRKASPTVTMGATGQSNDMDTIYAMGACVEPPIKSLMGFNFFEDKIPKSKFDSDLIHILSSYKDVALIVLICLSVLAGAFIFFQSQLKIVQRQYDQLSAGQGAYLNQPIAGIQAETQQNTETLTQYKNIRTKSDVAFIIYKVATHLPLGALLKSLNVSYDQTDTNDAHLTIDMTGEVFKEDPNEEIAVVNKIFSDFKSDKELSKFVKNVTVSLNLEQSNGRQVTGFTIHCS